jgi:hypothetical protein
MPGVPLKPKVVIFLIFLFGGNCKGLTPAIIVSASILKFDFNDCCILGVGAAHRISLLSPISSTKYPPSNFGFAQEIHIDFLWKDGSLLYFEIVPLLIIAA